MYGLLFHREPEPDKIGEYQNKAYVDLLVQAILRSSEFKSLNRQFEI
jgi:hypothetical protein